MYVHITIRSTYYMSLRRVQMRILHLKIGVKSKFMRTTPKPYYTYDAILFLINIFFNLHKRRFFFNYIVSDILIYRKTYVMFTSTVHITIKLIFLYRCINMPNSLNLILLLLFLSLSFLVLIFFARIKNHGRSI